MGDVKDRIVIAGLKSSKPIDVFFDTGADIGRINKSLVDELGLMLVRSGQKFTLGNGKEMKADVVAGIVNIKGCQFPAWFAVVEKHTPKATIGLSTMQIMGIELDPQKESYIVRCNIPKL